MEHIGQDGVVVVECISNGSWAAKFTKKILEKEQEYHILPIPFIVGLLSGMMIGIPSLPVPLG
jgi:hypothetical protein